MSILQRKQNVSYLSLLKIVIIVKKNKKRTQKIFLITRQNIKLLSTLSYYIKTSSLIKFH